jgi:nucleotide-binding universal stress UspA family protein
MAFGSAVASGPYGPQTANQVLAIQLQDETEQFSEDLSPGLAVDSHLFKGQAAALLIERSRALDLLVLGLRRYGPIKSVLLGTVSSDMLRIAYCPMVVVPQGEAE